MVARKGDGWKLARSLRRLIDEVDYRWPDRDKTYDGSIGDAAHRARESQHNPNDEGVVTAIDLTATGMDGMAGHILDATVGDWRVWYVIHNGYIWSRTYDWKRRRYTGSNPHTHHIHISLRDRRKCWDNRYGWGVVRHLRAKRLRRKLGGC